MHHDGENVRLGPRVILSAAHNPAQLCANVDDICEHTLYRDIAMEMTCYAHHNIRNGRAQTRARARIACSRYNKSIMIQRGDETRYERDTENQYCVSGVTLTPVLKRMYVCK